MSHVLDEMGRLYLVSTGIVRQQAKDVHQLQRSGAMWTALWTVKSLSGASGTSPHVTVD